ncbi:DNA mismatch repair protein msh6 [Apophysomyces sp. BC1034]|nr:DNA mismatch repair protein msh6 [Apophysomyces sp. BC1015]KAG0177327.1 DNA mismatch repair protein msh6 [Apophysomyces sp. BC1021]KAG0187625.1 DNA mismatch repair protein msh6 [Apophysomyces sp. BC1034]
MTGSSKQNTKNTNASVQAPPKIQKTLFSFFKSAAPKEKSVQDNPVDTHHESAKPSSDAPTNDNVEPMDIDDEETENNGPSPARTTRTRKKRTGYFESDDDEGYVNSSPAASSSSSDRGKKLKKKKTVRRISDDSEDEYNPGGGGNNSDDDNEIDVPDFDDENEDRAPKKTQRMAMSPLQERFKGISMKSPSMTSSAPRTGGSFLSSVSTKAELKKDRNQKFKEKNETRYSWLQDVKDADGNPEGSPEYDPRTLYIPKSAWAGFTPFEKQFWEVKSKQWDTVVFFKKGKFYELYEKDCDIGHKEFDLKMTDRVNMRMVGVPEMSFDYWAAQFIAKGHKVARVDQMETAIGKSMREREAEKGSKVDKIIRRELTSVLTAGTLVDAGLLTNDMSTYCMSIAERCPAEHVAPQFGICFVDTSTAEFNLVTFEDDINRTKFETLIMQIKPRELVTEKGRLSQATRRILKNGLNNPIWNMLAPEKEFWDALTTEDEIRIGGYFGEDTDMDSNSSWPHVLKDATKTPLLMKALGGLISYLRGLKLDKELLSAKNIHAYDPIRNTTSLVLDGQTLANLEIFENSYDGSVEGTVFKLLGNSITPFGKRLFKKWLCHPLRKPSDINARLDAIEDLMLLTEVQETMTSKLATMPDLERLISRIHSGRCKVKEFLTVLDGFRTAKDMVAWLKPYADVFKSNLLKSLIGNFPDINEQLDFFTNAFIIADVDIDYQKVKAVVPKHGVNQRWDELLAEIQQMEDEFNRHLQQLKKEIKCTRIAYKDLGKEIYQIEVPKDVKVPQNWIQLSTTSKVSRYWNSTIRGMVTKYKELLETKNGFIKNFTGEVYADFDKEYEMWLMAVQYIAQLDAIMGLAKASANLGEPACRPQLLDQETSVLEFEELRHPCVVPGVATDFIPNDTRLGGSDPSIIVLTGPNMGGKSTLLRQTCVAIIMAQLGCYVPARSCRITPCDRIYTRIGANDNIMAGQSTFMVELAETSKILHEATPRSMVILDELGRGTSTFDGYAIAYAVLHYLATHVGCLAMFSTHYQTLCREFERNPEINNMHMGYFMDEDENKVTFLYKLTAGICEKSFGMNVATMAGVPSSVVQKAIRVAEEFETTHRLKDTTYGSMDVDDAQSDLTGVTPAILSDFAYLWRAADMDERAEEIGDKAQDMVTSEGRQQRQTQVLRRILKGLSRTTM